MSECPEFIDYLVMSCSFTNVLCFAGGKEKYVLNKQGIEFRNDVFEEVRMKPQSLLMIGDL